MSSLLKLRRGSTVSHSTFTGADGEVTFNTDTNQLVSHDGATAGGFPHVKSADLAASSGSSVVGYLPAGTGAVATDVQAELRTVFRANNFGADATGATDTTTELQLAIAALNTAGTGTLIFDGEYNLGTNTSGTITKFDITASDATLIFRNGTKFTCTSDNHLTQLFVISGGSNINFEGVLHAESAVTNTYTTTGTTGIRAVTILNAAAANNGNIHIEAIRLIRGAAAVVIGSTYTSDNRVQGVYIGDIYTEDVTYGINCANNGDTVRCDSLTTDTAYRSWFAYGCKDHKGHITAIGHYTSGTVINLSRYSTAEGGSNTNTESFELAIKVIDPQTNVTCATLRHLGDGGATQKVQGIDLKISANKFVTGLTALQIYNFTGSGGSITATTFDAVMTNISISCVCENINTISFGGSNWTIKPVITWTGFIGPSLATVEALATVAQLLVLTGTSVTVPQTGLKFSGTPTASADVNVLDWYEEGTFTPTIVGAATAGTGTYTYQAGRYQRVGNRVNFAISLAWTAHTGTGNMRINGLPYTGVAINANWTYAFSVLYGDIAVGAGKELGAGMAQSSNQVSLYVMDQAGGAVTALTLDTAGSVYIQGTYEV